MSDKGDLFFKFPILFAAGRWYTVTSMIAAAKKLRQRLTEEGAL